MQNYGREIRGTDGRRDSTHRGINTRSLKVAASAEVAFRKMPSLYLKHTNPNLNTNAKENKKIQT